MKTMNSWTDRSRSWTVQKLCCPKKSSLYSSVCKYLKSFSDEIKFCPICGLRFPKYPHTLISYLLVFCQIPCLNGGRCIGQNECWCPSNATGKFCHLPTPTPSKPSQGRQPNSNRVQNGSSHTVYTLPLSNQQGKGRTIMVPMWRCLLHTDTS